MLGDCRKPGSCLALGLVGMCDGEEPAEVRVAAQVTGDQEQFGPIDLQGRADQRLDSNLPAGLKEADRPVHASGVGDCQGGHLELGRPHRQLGWMGSPVQEREVGVAVELDVGRHRFGRGTVSRL